LGYFGWNPSIISSLLFNIFYTECYSFWIVGWIFVCGVWTDVITANQLEINLKRAPFIISIGGGILFIIFQVIVVCICINFYVDTFTLIFNIVLALVLLSGCILIPIFGFLLLHKIRNFNNQDSIKKLRKKTKLLMASAFIFLLIFVILIIFIILENTIAFSPIRYEIFEMLFRIGEFCVVPTILLLATGMSMQNTFRSCVTGVAVETTKDDTGDKTSLNK